MARPTNAERAAREQEQAAEGQVTIRRNREVADNGTITETYTGGSHTDLAASTGPVVIDEADEMPPVDPTAEATDDDDE
jgi:hypothetical protein